MLKPSTATKKPRINDVKIDISEMLIVSQNPLIKKYRLLNPWSKVGSSMYHPQLYSEEHEETKIEININNNIFTSICYSPCYSLKA